LAADKDIRYWLRVAAEMLVSLFGWGLSSSEAMIALWLLSRSLGFI